MRQVLRKTLSSRVDFGFMDVKMSSERKDEDNFEFALVVQTKEMKMLNELRESLLQLIVTNSHWKQEWKVVVYNLAERAEITRVDGRIILKFRGSNKIYLILGYEITWCWDRFYLGGLARHEDLFTREFRNDLQVLPIPVNLWINVINAIYNVASARDQRGYPWYINEPGYVFIRSQHYNPNYPHQNRDFQSRPLADVVPDQWSKVPSYYVSPQTGRINWNSVFPNFSAEINTSQAGKLIDILFRHDKQKRFVATEWMQPLLSACHGNRVNAVDFDRDSCIIRRSISYLDSSDPLTKFVYDEQLIVENHFDHDEFTTLVGWLSCLKRENSGLIQSLFGASTNDFSSDFPNADDHFSDPSQLRGKLADTSLLHAVREFEAVVKHTHAELAIGYHSFAPADTIIKIPIALNTIITDYLPFLSPPPSPKVLMVEEVD